MLEYISPKSTKPPKILYHYTDIKGLEGIVGKEKIWATDHCFLNDKSEFVHGINVFKKIIAKREVELSDFFTSRYDYERDVAAVVGNIKRQEGIYCCSFTGNGNLLSQWRGYCPKEGGYSIGFSCEALRNLTKEQCSELFCCEYDKEEQAIMAKKTVEQLLLRFDGPAGLFECSNDTFHTHLRSDICFIASAFKNGHFREEAEWRLVSRRARGHAVNCRPDGKIKKPYIIFDLPNKAIEKIVIGPCKHPRRTKQALKDFVSSHGIDPKIIISDIPLR